MKICNAESEIVYFYPVENKKKLKKISFFARNKIGEDLNIN